MAMKFIPTENFVPIVRAIVTEARPRLYQQSAGITQLVADIIDRVSPSARVFVVESETASIMGFAIVKWESLDQLDIDYMLLRNTPASAYESIRAQLLSEAANHPPLLTA